MLLLLCVHPEALGKLHKQHWGRAWLLTWYSTFPKFPLYRTRVAVQTSVFGKLSRGSASSCSLSSGSASSCRRGLLEDITPHLYLAGERTPTFGKRKTKHDELGVGDPMVSNFLLRKKNRPDMLSNTQLFSALWFMVGQQLTLSTVKFLSVTLLPVIIHRPHTGA